MAAIIIEGLTGAGKSSTIAALQRNGAHVRFDEEATFGDFMNRWLDDPNLPAAERTRRLAPILDHISTSLSATGVEIIERFHLSYFALDGAWATYAAIDARAAELGIGLVLLDLPDAELKARSLYRREYDDADWQSFLDLYGSEAAALSALQRSQQRRRDALDQTCLRHLTIDTRDMAWDAYARAIVSFAATL
jgi:thymidylate kinase